MNTGYTPVHGRGFVRPGETKKPCYRVFSDIKKAAPIRSRLSEQLTCCEKIGSVQGDYINRMGKHHNYRITGKTKATCHGGPSTLIARYPQRMSIVNNATFAAGGQCDQCAGLLVGYSCSLALRRWRRLISPSSAETINCPVLSPSSFKFSTASAIAWGTRASSFLDFPLTAFVAISDFLVIRWLTVYTQENGKTLLTWLTPVASIVADTFIEVIDEKTKPAGATNTNGLLTTNDRKSIEVAMLNHTTHPQGRDSHDLNKYIWRFIALSTAQPRVITIEATSEQEARQQSPAGCVMVFAARIRQGVRHVQ
ncbi:host cell division inhibitor Icd-like protein [Escherichia coli]|nr:host cell division inhibitor Icd-like protein [Escherichia coli]MXJ49127.1 host cell division inhibitor Icd-like protein [Escherichia coli]